MVKSKSEKKMKGMGAHSSGGGLWFGGFIGALIYYWGDINTFWMFWVVLFKAIVWPIYVVNGLHSLLNL